MEKKQQPEYPCCVTPDFNNGLSTAPKLFEVVANRVSQLLKKEENTEKLDIPKICKNEIKCQFRKNYYMK